ncbi:hypothetical protein A9Q78_02350 [Methylophaga sp. 41_12_T18]|nr:hypothetical protein A9Q78_02350 [Methylophaga sp. 41_12_T18]
MAEDTEAPEEATEDTTSELEEATSEKQGLVDKIKSLPQRTLIIIAAALVIVLIGGGAAAYFLMGSEEELAEDELSTEEVAETAKSTDDVLLDDALEQNKDTPVQEESIALPELPLDAPPESMESQRLKAISGSMKTDSALFGSDDEITDDQAQTPAPAADDSAMELMKMREQAILLREENEKLKQQLSQPQAQPSTPSSSALPSPSSYINTYTSPAYEIYEAETDPPPEPKWGEFSPRYKSK